MEPNNPSAPTRPTIGWAFRPFWITASLGLLVLAADFHLRNAPRIRLLVAVTIEQRRPDEGFTVAIDGESHELYNPVTIGLKSIVITAPDAEPARRTFFVWYGINWLGEIDLRRSRGDLKLEVLPRPNTFTLQGPYGEFTNTSGVFTNIAAGKYNADFLYPELSYAREVRVKGNQSNAIAVINPIGSLELVATPNGGRFELSDLQRGWSAGGDFPFTFPLIRTGEYRLMSWRGDYQIEGKVTIRPVETNRTVVEFVYGGIEITSLPPGAETYVRTVRKGTTPLVLTEVIPGSYRVELRKEGFDPVRLDVSVTGTNTAQSHSVLVNTRYRESMELAKAAIRDGRFRRAQQGLETALEAQPNDTEALGLLPKTSAAAFREEAAERIDREDLSRAVEALEQAEKIEPDDATAKTLRARIAAIQAERERQRIATEQRKAEDERRRAQANARDALEAAASAIRSGNIERARAQLNEARKWVPDHPDLPSIEAEVQKRETKLEVELTAKRFEVQIQRRRDELTSFFEAVVQADTNRAVHTAVWRIGKPLKDLLKACEPEKSGGLPLSELLYQGQDVATWKSGQLDPIVGAGVYYRLAASVLAPGITEVRVKLYSLQASPIGPIPALNSKYNIPRIEDLRSSLSKALGEEIEDPTP